MTRKRNIYTRITLHILVFSLFVSSFQCNKQKKKKIIIFNFVYFSKTENMSAKNSIKSMFLLLLLLLLDFIIFIVHLVGRTRAQYFIVHKFSHSTSLRNEFIWFPIYIKQMPRSSITINSCDSSQ